MVERFAELPAEELPPLGRWDGVQAGDPVCVQLQHARVDPEPFETDAGDGPADALDGLTFVFTGSLSVPRGDAQAHVEAHGANATSSVSGNTDYLVAGESPGRSKRDDADAEGVPVVDEDGFADLLAERGIGWPPDDG